MKGLLIRFEPVINRAFVYNKKKKKIFNIGYFEYKLLTQTKETASNKYKELLNKMEV
jgi:hypothetical protein